MNKATIKSVAMGVAVSVLALSAYDAVVRPWLRSQGWVS